MLKNPWARAHFLKKPPTTGMLGPGPYPPSAGHVTTCTIDNSAAAATVTNSAVAKRRAAADDGSAASTIHIVASGSSVFVARRLSAGSAENAAATTVQPENAATGAISGARRTACAEPPTISMRART